MPSIPLIHLDRVYHVGSLDPSDRGRLHSSSQEGPCLSVSLCPEAWTAIARLGGSPLHEMRREGAVFLDVHAALDEAELRAVILGWAETEGLVVFREQWKAWRFDDETEEWGYLLADTREDAAMELDDEADGPDGGPAIELTMGYAATTGLADRLGVPPVHDVFAVDFAALAWARQVAPIVLGRLVDGVWFRDGYDPERLSAPRGGIFPEAVQSWTAEALPQVSIDDEEGLEAMPETVLVPMPIVSPPSPSAA